MFEDMARASLTDRFVNIELQDRKHVYAFDKKAHAQTLLHNLVLMQDNEEGSLTDVVIMSKENKKFHFHGPILAALSKELEENLLKQGPGSVTSKVVIKETFTSEALQCLWDYVYTSGVTLTETNISEVKELAGNYGLIMLKEECEHLKTNFDERFAEENCSSFKFSNQELPAIMLDGLLRLYAHGKFCSTALLSSTSPARVRCHGPVIAAACNVFLSELVFGDSNNIIEINDKTFQVIDHFLRYLYTAKLMIDSENVLPLLEFAVNFDVPSIGYACCCWLKGALSVENAFGIMAVARSCRLKRITEAHLETKEKEAINLSNECDDLYHFVRSFIINHFLKVKDSAEFPGVSLDMLIDVTADDGLVVDSEEDVFYAVMEWVEFDPETRGEELPNLLQSVRLEHFSAHFLHTIIEHHLMAANWMCMLVIDNALTECVTARYRSDRGKSVVHH